LHEVQTAENCQIEKRGRNEIITVAKFLLTNQMILVDDCDFSSIDCDFFVYRHRCVHPMMTISFEFPQIFSYE